MSEIAFPPATGDELLEREGALEALRRALAEACDQRSAFAVVSGEAGVGKTTLLRRFCEEQTKARVLWGACDPLFTPRPLGPVVDIAQSEGLELVNLASGDGAPYHVATALLDELHRRGPTVFVVEDVHWADEATLDVLRLVARRLEGIPAIVVVSHRDVGLDGAHPLRIVLGELAAGQRIDRVHLEPLSQEAVATLAEPYGVNAVELYRVTGGNPFFVTEVLASEAGEIPDTVRDAVLARAARLTPAARAVLEAVAIAPPEVDEALLEALCDRADGLDECLASGMLTVTTDGGIAFRHELARLAVDELVPRRRKTALHRRTLEELAARPESGLDLARLAHHAEAVGDRAAVLRFAPAAGARASSLGAHREAADQYARALRFADGLDPASLADLLRRRSDECYLTDQAEESIDALRRAVACYRSLGDRLREGDTLRRLSHILWCPGRGPDARETGLEAVTLLETLPPGPELAAAYGNLSFLIRNVGDLRAARARAEQALELAERLGNPEAVSDALLTLGMLEPPGTYIDGRSSLERGLDLARREELEKTVADGLFCLASMCAYARSYDLAEKYVGEGLGYCEEQGNDLMRRYFLAFRARTELDRGRWVEAAESARLVLAEPAVSTYPGTLALVVIGLVRARRGDPGIEAALEEARQLATPTGELVRIALVAAAEAEAAWLVGDNGRVAEITDGALRLAVEFRRSRVLGELRLWRRRAGADEPVEPFVEEPYAAELGGDFEQASATWAALGHPYEAALALAGADTEEPLQLAHAGLVELGARPAAAIVARRLREKGIRVARGPRASTRRSPIGLTSRETEVLELLAQGLRNADIAGRLVLSPRTVDHHVSAILRKLGTRTRGEAVAVARRRGLLQDR